MTVDAPYVYALTRADVTDLGPVPGLDGRAPVTLVAYRDIAAVTSPAPVEVLAALQRRPDRLGELARRHDDVVREVHRRAAVLPLRFGTVLAGPEAVHLLLERSAGETRARLDHVEGHAEWGVRVSTRPTRAAGGPADRSGAAYLTRRRDELAAAATALRSSTRAAEAVHQQLAERATDHVVRPGSAGDDLVVDVAYLVPVATAAAFTERFAELAGQHRLRLDLTGPWPPYSFARTGR